MSSIAFCAIDDAYADWSYNELKDPSYRRQLQPSQSQVVNEVDDSYNQPSPSVSQPSVQNSDKGVCPNCNSCLKANNMYQQRVVDQIISPRPQWIPQSPNEYYPYDPYNRYWANNNLRREDFGNTFDKFGFGNSMSTSDLLLKIILFMLIVLFIIQFIELIYKCTKE